MSNLHKVADEIADALGEKQYGPRKLVRAIVERCGARFSQQVLSDTEEVMAAGGMLTQEGDRLRTKGGVFFYLARGRMADETRNAIFPPRTGRGKQPNADTSKLPELVWAERAALFKPLLDESGKVDTVKITLIGRPGKLEIRKDVVVTTLTHTGGTPSLPKGVPPLPQTPTVYTVYIGARQWRKVEEALNRDPDDALIVDGICAFDPDLQTISVHATHVTTRATETTRKEAESGSDTAASTTGKAASSGPNTKLDDLRAAAELYRQKIATLQAKPAGERFGLEMTQKLLKNVEDEIASLEKAQVSTTT